MGDWICIIDTRCIIQRTNQAVERVLNVPADRVPGMHCHTLMHGLRPPSRDCPMTRMLASGRRESARMKLSDGRWLNISLDPVRSRICSACKRIRDAAGHWTLIETFVESHSNASFSHGICPDCMDRIYGDEPWYRPKKGRAKP